MRSSAGSECPCLELRSPCRLLLVDRSPWPCGHDAPSPACGLGSRHPVIFLPRRHGPDHPRLLVRERDRRNHLRFVCDEVREPAVRTATFANHPADHAHGPDDEQPSDIGLPHLADGAELGLAARGSLPRHETEPGGKVAPTVERVEIGSEGGAGPRGYRANPRDRA